MAPVYALLALQERFQFIQWGSALIVRMGSTPWGVPNHASVAQYATLGSMQCQIAARHKILYVMPVLTRYNHTLHF